MNRSVEKKPNDALHVTREYKSIRRTRRCSHSYTERNTVSIQQRCCRLVPLNLFLLQFDAVVLADIIIEIFRSRRIRKKILVLIVLLGVCTAAVVEVIGKPGIPAKPKEDELVTAETQRQFGGGHGGLC